MPRHYPKIKGWGMGNKYKNKKCKLDGYVFDSIAEASYYHSHIKPRIERGEISHLELHPKIKCEIGGKHICYYNADFRYLDKLRESPQGAMGCSVIVEVKGFKTDVYKLKIKLVTALHPHQKILVISAKDLKSEILSLKQAELLEYLPT